MVLLKCLRPKLPLRAMIFFHCFERIFLIFWFGKTLTSLLSSWGFILNLIQCISELIGWEEIYWPWWISASQNLQLLHLVLVRSTVWFSNKQTKYPRCSYNWSELYTEKSMIIFRNSQFVRSTDKFYLAWFNFKYDLLILDTLELKNLNTTTSVAMPAQTHPSLLFVSWSLKLENLKPINESPESLYIYAKSILLVLL